MPRPDAKIRRGPYGPQNLPDDIRQHGYVADLITVITQAADNMGQPIRIFRKNADWYIGVIIPNRAELAKIDAHTEAFSTRGESEAWITRRGPCGSGARKTGWQKHTLHYRSLPRSECRRSLEVNSTISGFH